MVLRFWGWCVADGLTHTDRTIGPLNTPEFDFTADQTGMFSLLPLAPAVIKALKTEHGIFLVEDGRINIAGLNEQTDVHFADCVAKVG